MKQVKIPHSVQNDVFCVEWHYMTGQTESLHRVAATPQFQWIRGRFGLPYGMCYLDKRYALPLGVGHVYEYMNDLRLTVERQLVPEGYAERYVWQNVGKQPIHIEEREVGVYATFAQQYDIPAVTLSYRAYSHIFAAHSVMYIANSFCDGREGGVGLVLREGCVGDLGSERLDPRQHGDTIVYLPSCTLAPGQTAILDWLVFDYASEADFWGVVQSYSPKVCVSPRYPRAGDNVCVMVGDITPSFVWINGVETPNPFPCPEGQFLLSLAPIPAQDGCDNSMDVGEKPVQNDVDGAKETEGKSDDEEVATCGDSQEMPVLFADDKAVYWLMSGTSYARRWADLYRSLGRGRVNPREALVRCDEALARFASANADLASGESPDTTDYEEAVEALSLYYRRYGGMRRVDACLPYGLIKSNANLQPYFAKQLARALKKKSLFGAQYVLAMADITYVGKRLGLDCAGAHQQFAIYAKPLLHAPFGDALASWPWEE